MAPRFVPRVAWHRANSSWQQKASKSTSKKSIEGDKPLSALFSFQSWADPAFTPLIPEPLSSALHYESITQDSANSERPL